MLRKSGLQSFCSNQALVPLCKKFMSEPSTRVKKTVETLRSVRPTVLPSLLQCDFANLEREVHRLEEAGVECLHLDVMDGNFVPNLSYGMPIVAAIRKVTDLLLDVHLMIQDPVTYGPQFVDAGADMITFHIEAIPQPSDLLATLRGQGGRSGFGNQSILRDDDGFAICQSMRFGFDHECRSRIWWAGIQSCCSDSAFGT